MFIGHIKGIIEEKITDKSNGLVVIDVNGVGYNIHVSSSTLAALPPVGEFVKIYTHTEVGESTLALYGFQERYELEFFKKLIEVNTVGPTVAMKALAGISVNDFISAIVSGDTKRIAKLPGLGEKKASKIILDLRDKVDFEDVLENISGVTPSYSEPSEQMTDYEKKYADAMEEANLAMISLGYNSAIAKNAVKNSMKELEEKQVVPDSSNLLKGALKFI